MSITDDGWLDHGATGLQGEAESEAEGEPEPAAAAEAEADADLAQDLDRSLGAGGGADVASEVAYSDDFEAPSDSEDAADHAAGAAAVDTIVDAVADAATDRTGEEIWDEAVAAVLASHPRAEGAAEEAPGPAPAPAPAPEEKPRPEPEPEPEPEPDEQAAPPTSPHVVHVRADELHERFAEIPSPFGATDPAPPAPAEDAEPAPAAAGQDLVPADAAQGRSAPDALSDTPVDLLFSALDADGDGVITREEMREGLAGGSQPAADDAGAEASPAEESPATSTDADVGTPVAAAPPQPSVPGQPPATAGAPDGAPTTTRILAGIQGQQEEMQHLQSSLATAASEQAARQHLLIEQQLTWYRQQHEQQQRQLEQVQQVSQQLIKAEAEHTKSKLAELQAQQQRVEVLAAQPSAAVSRFDTSTSTVHASDAAIDQAAESSHRTLSKMNQVVEDLDALLPDEPGQESVGGEPAATPTKTRTVSFGDARSTSTSEAASKLGALPTAQLMTEMGARVHRALDETSTVTKATSSPAPKLSPSERADVAEGAVSDYYQRMRMVMKSVSSSADREGGRVLQEGMSAESEEPVLASTGEQLDAISMMPPSCWPVSPPSSPGDAAPHKWEVAGVATELSLEVQRRISSVANGTSTVPMQTKPKRKLKKKEQTAARAVLQTQPPAPSLSSAPSAGPAQTAPPPQMPARAAAPESTRSVTDRVKPAAKKQAETAPVASRQSWLTLNRTKSVSSVFRKSSSEYVAHLANVEAVWRGGLAGSMIKAAPKPDPRWVAARHADQEAVEAALAKRRSRRSALDYSSGQAVSLLGEYSLAVTSGQTVVNLYGQQGRQDKPELHHLKSAVTKFLRQVQPEELTLYKVGCELLPHSGDHLDWSTQVRPVLEELASRYKCRMIIWEQEPGKRKKHRSRGTRKPVGIAVPQGRRTVRSDPQTYSDNASQPTNATTAIPKKPRRSRSPQHDEQAQHPARERDNESHALQAALTGGMAEQMRVRLAAAMPSAAREADTADSADLLEQLAVKAIRTEVASVLRHQGTSEAAGGLHSALSRGFRGHSRTDRLHLSSDGASTTDSSSEEAEGAPGGLAPAASGSNFDNRVRGLVMALLSDGSRDLLEPLPYGDYGVASEPFPNEPAGPCLLSTGAAGAWSLTRGSGQIVIDDEAFDHKERKRRRAAQRRAKAEALLRSQRPKTLRHVFLGWADWAGQLKRNHELMKKIAKRWSNMQVAGAFTAMRDSWAQKKANREKIGKMLGRMMRGSLRGCFTAWSGWASRKRFTSAAVKKLSMRLVRRSKQAAFSGWKADVIMRKRLRDKLAEANRIFPRGRLASAFLRWAALGSDGAKSRRRALEQALLGLHDKEARVAFANWKSVWREGRQAARRDEVAKAAAEAAAAEASRIAELEKQLAAAQSAASASAAAAAAAAAASSGGGSPIGKDVKVSVNWDELLGGLGPRASRPQPDDPPSPIRFAPSNAHDLRDDSDYSPRQRSYKSNARLLQSDSDYSDEVLDPDTGRQRGRRQAASKPKRRPGETSAAAAARRRREQRRPWQNPDPTYYDEWRVDARDKFAAQLKEERELSGSEASLPSSRWDSADEDAGGPNPKLRPPLDLDAFDRATQPVDPRNVWKVDSSLSEGEVAWPQSAAGAQTFDGYVQTAGASAGPVWQHGYESDGEVQPGVTSAALSPGRVV